MNLLYGNVCKQVMDVLTNNEAYNARTKTKEIIDKKSKENLVQLLDEINTNIDDAVNKGEYKCITYFKSKTLSKENKKYIQNLYKEKGYKIKFKLYFDLDEYSNTNYNRKIIISWKPNLF